MHLCVDNPAGTPGNIYTMPDGATCASVGYVDYHGPMTGYPPLTVAEVDQLAWGVALCWAVAWGFRFIARQIPRPR